MFAVFLLQNVYLKDDENCFPMAIFSKGNTLKELSITRDAQINNSVNRGFEFRALRVQLDPINTSSHSLVDL